MDSHQAGNYPAIMGYAVRIRYTTSMLIVGIDEVGRGSWAGPLVVGAVILRRRIPGLKDSKLLNRQQREVLAAKIHKQAISVGMGWVAPDQVDALGLTAATRLAAEQAIAQISCAYDEIIIDGNYNYLASHPKARALIKADAAIPAVSAASIVAKVARDQYMIDAAQAFPHYQFESHVGYGTPTHRKLLALHGACELHRMSFKPLKDFLVA